MVEKLVSALEQYELLADTYILLTSDHGYHLGQFAMPLDKRLPYDFDIRVGNNKTRLLIASVEFFRFRSGCRARRSARVGR